MSAETTCLFCKIATKTLPSDLLYEDEVCVVIRDIHPAAPVHVLVIPKRHLPRLSDLSDAQADLAGHLLLVLRKMARELKIEEDGYRTVINSGDAGGQTVDHLHLHLLGGRTMTWPPG